MAKDLAEDVTTVVFSATTTIIADRHNISDCRFRKIKNRHGTTTLNHILETVFFFSTPTAGKNKMSKLFTPVRLGPSLELANRIIVSPMCQYSAVDGIPNDWHLVHLGSMATHGCATICVEATGVTFNGRISPACTGIWNDQQLIAHKRIVDFVRSQGSVIGIQIGHAGRKASSQVPYTANHNHTLLAEEKDGGWPDDVWAPSAIPWDATAPKPKELTQEKIKELVKSFGDAADRCVKAGYQFIEIHAAHGYLLSEFISPLTNKRNDEYGGSFQNRCRAVFEIAQEIRTRVGPNFPVGIRYSCFDWVEGGTDPEDIADLSLQLTQAPYNLNFFDCSSGGVDPRQKFPEKIPLGYQVDFAHTIKKKVGENATVIAVGMIVDPHQAEDIVSSGKADAVMLARQILREPSFTFRAARELGGSAHYPTPYMYSSSPAPTYIRQVDN